MIVAAPGVTLQASRLVMIALMLAAVLAVAPLYAFDHVRPLTLVPGALALIWRLWMFGRGARAPALWHKALLVLLTLVVVFASYMPRMFALEPAVALLVATFHLKLLETQRQRDVFITVVLGYFVVAMTFLFDQTLATSAYVLGVVILLTSALGLQTANNADPPLRSVRRSVLTSATLLLQAAPLAALVFLFFPRVSPLWTVPLAGQAHSGLSDTLQPFEIAKLTKNPEVVFRASFDGPLPPSHDLYWRSLIYYEFDGDAWRQGIRQWPDHPEAVDWTNDGLKAPWLPRALPSSRYEVIAEPTSLPWLYSLDFAFPETRSSSLGVTRDGRLLSWPRGNAPAQETAMTKREYSALRAVAAAGSTPQWMLAASLQLPAGVDPKTRALAQSLWRAHPTVSAFVAASLHHLQTNGFTYTLTPPRIDAADSIDRFMFESRRGFCAHYAASFVFMARSVGIPARIVAGYQGGEINRVGGFLTVRQYDAHAWAEVYSPDMQRWLRVDPTSVVSPERVEGGMDALMADVGVLDHPLGMRSLAWVAGVMDVFDNIEHEWTMWVIGYDANLQSHVLQDWFGAVSWQDSIVWLIIGGAVMLVAIWVIQRLVLWANLWRSDGLVRALDRWGEAHGEPRRPQETIDRYVARLIEAFPRQRERITKVGQALTRRLYEQERVPTLMQVRQEVAVLWLLGGRA